MSHTAHRERLQHPRARRDLPVQENALQLEVNSLNSNLVGLDLRPPNFPVKAQLDEETLTGSAIPIVILAKSIGCESATSG